MVSKKTDNDTHLKLVDDSAAGDRARPHVADALLYSLGKTICTEISTSELLRRIVDVLTELLGADRGTLYMLDEAREQLVSVAAHLPELKTIRVPLSQGVAGEVARTQRLIRIDSCATDSRFWSQVDEKTGYITRNMLTAPVHGAHGRLLGVAQVLNKRDGTFTAEDADVMSVLAEQVGQLLEETTVVTGFFPSRLPEPEHGEIGLVADERPEFGLEASFNRIVGQGTRMQRVFADIRKAAPSEAVVLLTGDAGTGKSMVARALHHNSRRADSPLVAVNCTAQNETLIETELFGVERESWPTGRIARPGRCEDAAGGTLYLGEIGALSASAQGRLMTLLERKQVDRVGGHEPVACDVRVIVSSRRSLEALVREGRLREDLYYRVRGVRIELPALQRRGLRDLRLLIDHFLAMFARRHRKRVPRVHPDAMRALQAHHWPGNIRELENGIESAVVLAQDMIMVEHLPLPLAAPAEPERDRPGDPFSAEPSLAELEARYIGYLLDRFDGNRTLVATKLGVGRNTLLRKIRQYHLE
ncbi:MAG: sigma-54-dependent Fis family transcriptional regulator [Deltaproteobacteria bacterium]|nr:sigma-54-dependent Fis family transcriptional regulator [Deltaproteobacteria bacterium]